MQKTYASSSNADNADSTFQSRKSQKMEPSTLTLEKIMQFASSYRPQKFGKNQHIDLIVN